MVGANFIGFEGREQGLQKIKRFRRIKVMFYRTNVLFHSMRVPLILQEFLPIAEKEFGSRLDSKKAITMAYMHDDIEVETDDLQLYYKLRMGEDELAKHRKKEVQAIENLAARWPKMLNGYSYRQLLLHVLDKDCLEAQLVSYADKIDAFCESLHELFAGNRLFPIAVQDYLNVLPTLPVKFPELAKIVPGRHAFLQPIPEVNFEKILSRGRPHDESTIKQDSGIAQYEAWKKLTVQKLGLRPLIEKVE